MLKNSNVNNNETKRNKALIWAFLNIKVERTLLILKEDQRELTSA
jgi:hypothetical protein